MVIINEKKPTELLASDFYYDLPERLIAQHPADKRDHSRLMIIDRKSGAVEHKHFYDIIDYLHEGDVLVINDSKVIPARLYGHPEERKEAQLELLLLRQRRLDEWECLVKPSKIPSPKTALLPIFARLPGLTRHSHSSSLRCLNKRSSNCASLRSSGCP